MIWILWFWFFVCTWCATSCFFRLNFRVVDSEKLIEVVSRVSFPSVFRSEHIGEEIVHNSVIAYFLALIVKKLAVVVAVEVCNDFIKNGFCAVVNYFDIGWKTVTPVVTLNDWHILNVVIFSYIIKCELTSNKACFSSWYEIHFKNLQIFLTFGRSHDTL